MAIFKKIDRHSLDVSGLCDDEDNGGPVKKIVFLIFSLLIILPGVSLAENARQSNFTVQSSAVVPIVWQEGDKAWPDASFGNSYSYTDNIISSSEGFVRTDMNSVGTIISNIYNTGEFRAESIRSNDSNLGHSIENDPNNTGGCENELYVRSGGSASETESASWIRVTRYSPYNDVYKNQYLQWKAVIKDSCGISSNYFIIFNGLQHKMWGQILDSSTKQPIKDATIKIGTTSVKTFHSDSHSYGYMTGIKPNTDGWYEISNYYKTTGNTIEVLSVGYENYSEKLSVNSSEDFFNSSNLRKDIYIKKTSTSSTTKKSTTTTTTPTKPTLALSTTSRIGTNDISSTLDTTKPISIIPTQKLTFSGTTSANAKVTLTIKSDPITKEVTADATGSWTYTLDPKELALETGNHTVTAIATDTAGVKSDEVALGTFELKSPPIATPAPKPYKFQVKDLLTPINYVFGGILLLLIGGLIFMIVKRRKQIKLNISNQMS